MLHKGPGHAWIAALPIVAVIPMTVSSAGAPLRVAVRVASSADATFVERIRGQTSDLDITLMAAPAEPPEPSLADQMETARTLADGVGADVVLWFTNGPEDAGLGAVLVHVADVHDERVLVRLVGGGTDGGGDAAIPDSATIEQVALVVRSTLRALAAGGTIGVEVPPAAGAPPPVPPPAAIVTPVPAASASPPPAPDPDPADARLRWAAGIGWDVVFDGGAREGQHAVEFRVGPAVAWLALSVRGRAGLPAELPDRWATVALSRHGVGVGAEARIGLATGLDLSIGLELGAVAYHRSAGDAAPGVDLRAPRSLWSFLLAPEARLIWRPAVLAGLGFVLAVAGDWLPAAPRFGYDEGGVFAIAHELHAFQPRVGLGLVFESR